MVNFQSFFSLVKCELSPFENDNLSPLKNNNLSPLKNDNAISTIKICNSIEFTTQIWDILKSL